MEKFHFWCQKVLPLVYDDSLSYYEVLGKMANKLNEIITNWNDTDQTFNELQSEIDDINRWINNFDTSYIEELVENYVATMIFVGINDNGYIFYDMPESWNDIQFNTTGLDISVTTEQEYGHLVLSY